MNNDTSKNNGVPTIRDLYPNFTEEQLEEAEIILEEYLEVVLEIFEYNCLKDEEGKLIDSTLGD